MRSDATDKHPPTQHGTLERVLSVPRTGGELFVRQEKRFARSAVSAGLKLDLFTYARKELRCGNWSSSAFWVCVDGAESNAQKY